MLKGLDLFSGIGGITYALQDWVSPIAYCENDKYAQGVLLSRMSEGKLPIAPIWTDVTTLKGSDLPIKPNIIYGGFPCVGISNAGNKKGLEDKRSGLFFEIVRLVDEIRPQFVFMENVSTITLRGLDLVCKEFTQLGYDSRWCVTSARESGALHKRERWFMLCADTSSDRCNSRENYREERQICFDQEQNNQTSLCEKQSKFDTREMGEVFSEEESIFLGQFRTTTSQNFWGTIPDLDRVDSGVPYRVERIKCLGNSVVPQQTKEAFERLMGLKRVTQQNTASLKE